MKRRPMIGAITLLLVCGLTCRADADRVDYAKDIQPILAAACYSCHGPDKQKAQLRLDQKSAAFKGGEAGVSIIPHDASKSLLIQLVSGQDPERMMPKKGDPLSPSQIATLRAWIDSGAPWPDDAATESDKKDWWSLRPVAAPPIPVVKDAPWAKSPIDAFIFSRLEKEHLKPSAPADRRTLLRRVTFDLTGLPPTPAEIEQFLADASPDAYEKVVDRLLASPRFGERWARHWLDVVRFAETNGFEMNQPRPAAWPYRDWVIQAFNADMPYDQFVRAQIAGDATGDDVATSFLVAGPWDQVKSPDPVLTAQQRADELHDMVSVTGSTFLGLTVGCARCHDHKFDPISQTDYYRMTAIFAGVNHGQRALPLSPVMKKELQATRESIARIHSRLEAFVVKDESAKRRPAVVATLNDEHFTPTQARFIRFSVNATSDGSEPCIDELEIFTAGDAPKNIALVSAGVKLTSSGDYPDNPFHTLQHLSDGEYGNSKSWISNQAGKGWVQVELPAVQTIDHISWGRDRQGKFTDRLATQYVIEVAVQPAGPWQTVASSADRTPYTGAAASKPRYAASTPADQAVLARLLADQSAEEQKRSQLTSGNNAYAGTFAQPAPTHRLFRGDPMSPKEVVSPGGIAAVSPALDLPANAPEQQRRLALARWITNPANPLAARVIVNRLWHYHFGNGFVATPSDLGHMGAKPTHPELLDHLAGELIKNKWSLKAIHRQIVLCETYRQSSATNALAATLDADARLLWRYPPRRLEAETIRDSILAVSGKLDLAMGGPGFDLFKPNSNYVRIFEPRDDFGPEQFRRMIYQFKPRLQPDGVFAAFDIPDGAQVAPRRQSSVTPLQALNLLNSRFMLDQSQFFAQRLEQDAGDNPAAQISRAFALAFGREPNEVERAAAARLIEQHGLPAFCRALYNANEFLYVH